MNMSLWVNDRVSAELRLYDYHIELVDIYYRDHRGINHGLIAEGWNIPKQFKEVAEIEYIINQLLY